MKNNANKIQKSRTTITFLHLKQYNVLSNLVKFTKPLLDLIFILASLRNIGMNLNFASEMEAHLSKLFHLHNFNKLLKPSAEHFDRNITLFISKVMIEHLNYVREEILEDLQWFLYQKIE